MKGGTERVRAYSFEYVATYDQKSLSSEHLQRCNMITTYAHEITGIHETYLTMIEMFLIILT